MQRSVPIVCAPVLSGLDAAVQVPGRLPGARAALPVTLRPHALPPLPPLFLRSIRPALEGAFGTEDAAHFPEAVAALVARLHAGPLGPARAGAPAALAA